MNHLTFPILRMLADGHFHSGEALARHFKVTRATVWNALQEAESQGVEIFSVRGRGYKLPQPLQLLEPHAIMQSMGEWRSIIQLQLHDQLESTNSYLMQLNAASQGLPSSPMHATCVAAELQTRGRGRRGRSWQAGLGTSLTFSLLWRFQCGASALSGLSLAVGIALIRALHELGIQRAKLKWPNDVLIPAAQGYLKLAGILIELQGDMDGPSTAVIGIGVNLNLPEALRHSIDQPATDLHSVLGMAADPNLVLGTLLRHLGLVLGEFEHHGFEPLRQEWLSHHAYQQQQVRLLLPDHSELHGSVVGVAADGVLLVQTAQGLQRFSAGEISLRPVAS